jgi:hypothetical protein
MRHSIGRARNANDSLSPRSEVRECPLLLSLTGSNGSNSEVRGRASSTKTSNVDDIPSASFEGPSATDVGADNQAEFAKGRRTRLILIQQA